MIHPNLRLGTTLASVVLGLTMIASVAAASQVDPEQPIDIDLAKADLVQTLSVFATIQDLALDAPSDLDGKVTITIDSKPWSDALAQVCEAHGLACRVEAPNLVVRRANEADEDQGMPISIDLIDADLHQTLLTFGRIADMEVTIDPGVPADTVTITLDGVPWPLALDEICRLSGCAARASDGGIEIEPLPPSKIADRRVDLAVDSVAVTEVLERFRGLPFWDGVVSLEVEPSLAARPVTLDVRAGTWSELLSAICNEAACDWKLVFDKNGHHTLRITDLQGALASLTTPAAFEGSLHDAMAALREHLGLPVRATGGLATDQSVRWRSIETDGAGLLDALCGQADCRWHLRGGGVQLVPRDPRFPALAQGHDGPALSIRLTTPESVNLRRDHHFNWAHPAVQLGDDQSQALMLWLPFGDSRQMLLPVLVDCDAASRHGNEGLAVLDPIALPIDGETVRRAGGFELTVSQDPAKPAVRVPSKRFTHGCVARADAPSVDVSFADPAGALSGRQRMKLDSTPGHFLLLTPPAGSAPTIKTGGAKPSAALVTLGDRNGHPVVAVIEPRRGGGFEIGQTVTIRAPRTITLQDGSRLVLDLSP